MSEYGERAYLHAEAGAFLKSSDEEFGMPEPLRVDLLQSVAFSGTPNKKIVDLVVSKVMELREKDVEETKAQSVKMMLALHGSSLLMEFMPKSIAEGISKMPADRRLIWLAEIGEWQQGDEASTRVGARVRHHLGESYAWREREELGESIVASNARRKGAGL